MRAAFRSEMRECCVKLDPRFFDHLGRVGLFSERLRETLGGGGKVLPNCS